MATLVMSLRIECINRDSILRFFQKIFKNPVLGDFYLNVSFFTSLYLSFTSLYPLFLLILSDLTTHRGPPRAGQHTCRMEHGIVKDSTTEAG